LQLFTVSRNTIFKTLIMSTSAGWLLWVLLTIGLGFTLLGCFYDIRYLILGLIVCFTMLPTMAFFIFVNYMFASEMVANLLNHTVERRNDGYLLRIYRPADPNDPIEKDKEWIESARLTFFDHNIMKTKTTPEYEVIFLKDSPLSILYVPR
ncbi:MAG: hypothetical protein K2J58_02410, partial [Muribaculaceae bacterium]|nr:hypothetical protein [Muribaculaceae bacterium]